jgi:TctA family transporter
VILVFCCIGVFTVNNTTTDVLVMALFGVFGYLLLKIRCEPAPLILGLFWGRCWRRTFAAR